MAKEKKFYVVWKGGAPGIYDSWTACRQQVQGYPDARYMSFPTLDAAREALAKGPPAFARTKTKPAKGPVGSIRRESISVDAACSGNPGKMEYQGVDTLTRERIFHQSFPLGTNNIGEFLAIVHALALLKKKGEPHKPIYSDSRNAILWVKKGKCKTTLEHNDQTARLFEVIDRAEDWLANNSWSNPLLKWETEHWGEIPADFGRK